MKHYRAVLAPLFIALSLVLAACVGPENSPNLPPTAVMTADPASGTVTAPATVTFDAGNSTDPDGSIASFRWFIDGSPASTEPSFDHAFLTPGSHVVRLEVTDDRGATHAAEEEYGLVAGSVRLPESDIELDFDAVSTTIAVESSHPWTLTSSAAWLTLEPTSGPAGTTAVTLTVDHAALTSEPTSTLTLTGATGATDTITVSVLLPELAGPFPDRIELRAAVGNAADGDFAIMNSGAGTLRLELEASTGWLSVTPASAVIAPGEDAVFTVTGSCAAAASYAGDVTIASNVPGAGPAVVAVELDCIEPVASEFDITLRYLGDTPPTPEVQAVFRSAAARWSELITGDLTDVTATTTAGDCGATALSGEPVDDLLIWVRIEPIDGQGNVLGMAGPCHVRNDGRRLPLTGVMTFDSADVEWMETQGLLEAVMLHEMGHVLGIGTYWELSGLGHMHLDAGCTPGAGPRRFTGVEANAGHLAAGGADGMLLVETDGGAGTACGHWDEESYYHELMTGWVDAGANPLSAITVGSLADLGYEVSYALADPYGVPLPGALRGQGAGPRIDLENVLRPEPILLD